jgi:acyl carrier protein
MKVEERIKRIISRKLELEEEVVTPRASFAEDLGAVSLDTVELIMAYEDEFKIQISEDDAEKLVTVQDAIDYIKGRIS